MRLNNVNVASLSLIGSGSYGVIYIIPGGTNVMKEHAISDASAYEGCETWRHEYNMHTAIYQQCTPLLPAGFSIVRPVSFGYAKRKNSKLMTTNSTNATSCYIVMERIFGRNPHNPHLEEKLTYILAEPAKFTLTSTTPFYMYMGSCEDYPARYITLSMLRGSHLNVFQRETLNYCDVAKGSIADLILKRMIETFFLFVHQGFIPRDIEFVLNGNKGDTLITVLDFNEVKTISERAAAVHRYSLYEDIASVYIDLCGLRKENTQHVNPQAPYDYGTPQWKFLCSPMTAPGAFLTIARSMPEYATVFEMILRKCIKPKGSREWAARAPVFSQNGDPTVFLEFDTFFQERIVNTLLDIYRKKKMLIPTLPEAYAECTAVLNQGLHYVPQNIESWGELF
jgi:hypothetical protein